MFQLIQLRKYIYFLSVFQTMLLILFLFFKTLRLPRQTVRSGTQDLARRLLQQPWRGATLPLLGIFRPPDRLSLVVLFQQEKGFRTERADCDWRKDFDRGGGVIRRLRPAGRRVRLCTATPLRGWVGFETNEK